MPMTNVIYHQPYQSDLPDWSKCAPEIPPDCREKMASLRARFAAEHRQNPPAAVRRDRKEMAFLAQFCEKANLAFPTERYPEILAFAQWWIDQYGWNAVLPDSVTERWDEYWAKR